MVRRWPCVFPSILVSLLTVACAEPPNTEINRAQGAIDAARAAGAEQYATTEYSAATGALENANNAVAAGDYRLALNYALESHEHAQSAARDTADSKARARADVERAIPQVLARIAQARARLTVVGRSGVPRRLLTAPAKDLDAAEDDLQKAGEAVSNGDYLKAATAVAGIKERVEKTLATVNAAAAPRSGGRRR